MTSTKNEQTKKQTSKWQQQIITRVNNNNDCSKSPIMKRICKRAMSIYKIPSIEASKVIQAPFQSQFSLRFPLDTFSKLLSK